MKSKLKKLLKNQAAFALMEVMVAAGVMGVVSYGIMELIRVQNQQQRNLQLRAEAMGIAQEIRVTLMNANACINTFRNMSMTAATSTGSKTQLNASGNEQIRRGDPSASVIYYQGQKFLANSLVLQEIYFTGYNRTSSSPQGTFILQFKHYQGSSTAPIPMVIGSSQYTVPVSIEVANTSTHPVVNCYSDINQTIDTSMKEMCADIGGTWTAAVGTTLGNCVPPDFACRHYGNTQVIGPDGTAKWAPRRWNGSECVPCTPNNSTNLCN